MVKKGTALEVYAGTNLPLEHTPKDPYLFRKNKWIIAHAECADLVQRGVVPAIRGKNYKVGIDV